MMGPPAWLIWPAYAAAGRRESLQSCMGVITSCCEGIPLLQYVTEYSSKILDKSIRYSDFDLSGELGSLHTNVSPSLEGEGSPSKCPIIVLLAFPPPAVRGLLQYIPWNPAG